MVLMLICFGVGSYVNGQRRKKAGVGGAEVRRPDTPH